MKKLLISLGLFILAGVFAVTVSAQPGVLVDIYFFLLAALSFILGVVLLIQGLAEHFRWNL